MRLTSPNQILADGSAVGLQIVIKDVKTDRWMPDPMAAVLLIEGRDAFRTVFTVNEPSAVRFRLVCGPCYVRRTCRKSRKRRKLHKPRPIQVRWPYNRPNRGPETYDMDWEVRGIDIPPGLLCFEMSPPRPSPCVSVDCRPPYVSKTFTCSVNISQVDTRGEKTKHELDKCFQLVFVTDPGTKYVVVDEIVELRS